jgi:predicted esterase
MQQISSFMHHHTMQVQRTAHYYQIGEPGAHIKQFWIVCHGYAQLADAFLENFASLDNSERLIIAPEGLNHFYQRGFDGPVVANWMTRHHREAEIADYSGYLQGIYDKYAPLLPKDCRIVLLGFSQGTATVCRWIIRTRPAFHDLLLWAGMPPEDLDYAQYQEYFATKNLYLLYGSNDPFLTPDRLSGVQDIEARNGIDFEEQPFEGGHEIQIDMLREILKKMI